jgi:hypothetical protein
MRFVPLNGEFLWQMLDSVDYYNIQLSDNIDFINPIIDKNTNKENKCIYSGLKEKSVYYWRVRYSKASKISAWSKTYSFVSFSINPLTIPVILNPKDGTMSVGTSDTLVWAEVPGATSYQISISHSSDFDESEIKTENIKESQYIFKNLDYNQIHFWRVSAKNAISESNWSEVAKFVTELKTPDNIYPNDSSVDIPTNVTITWDPVSGSSSYLILLSESKFFPYQNDSIIIQNTTSYQCSLKNNKTYFMKIRAGLGDYNTSKWSDLITFSTSITSGIIVNNIQDIEVFPNPVVTYLKFKDNQLNGLPFIVYNQNGKLQFYGILSSSTIDFSNESCGTYYIYLNNKLIKINKL